jgi:hypothetical protein
VEGKGVAYLYSHLHISGGGREKNGRSEGMTGIEFWCEMGMVGCGGLGIGYEHCTTCCPFTDNVM